MQLSGNIKLANKVKFITLEGVDGAGKSTHIEFIKKYFIQNNIKFVMTREPGGTALGEKLRELLLHDEMHPETETLLMFAARSEHIQKIINPNLENNICVISDRFTDATYAYQSGAKFVSKDKITQLMKWTHNDLVPDLTLLFDLPTEISIERLNKSGVLDKFEREEKIFHDNIRKAYLDIAKKEKKRFRVIDSSKSIEVIQQKIKLILKKLFL
tara:strand:+ start:23 stop:664 length:642 start_codon:yes stop_codon:yes gene_type:complete